MYSSSLLDPDNSSPSLQDKVEFDLHFFFVWCSNENMDTFTKETFKLHVDPNTDFKFIRKEMDEAKKKYQIDTFIPEWPLM